MSEQDTTSHQQIVDRVQALLRKAESSEFPEEADALLAKAQELITRHALDEAQLADPSGLPGISHENLEIEGSYSYERALIWGAVAHPNRCRALNGRVYGSRRVATLVLIGRPADRDLVKILATALEQQALRYLPTSQPGDGRGDLVLRRRSYLLGFAGQVSRRLADAVEAVEQADSLPGSSLTHVDDLDGYIAEMFSTTQDRSRTTLDAAAYNQGTSAADGADLGQSRLKQRRQLGA